MSSSLVKPKSRGASLDRMTDAQQVFVLEYIANGGNGAHAAKKAYPRNSNPSQAACQALRHPVVAAYLGKVLKAKLDEADLSATRILRQLEAALFLDPIDLFDKCGPGVYKIKDLAEIPERVRQCITGIECKTKERTLDDGSVESETWFEVRLMDKNKALELAMKFRGLVEPEQNTLNVNVGSINFDELSKPPDRQDIVEGRILEVQRQEITKE